MKTEPSYEELTAEAEAGIKLLVRYSQMAKTKDSVPEWRAWRERATSLHRLWRETVDDCAWKERDSIRLLALIPFEDVPPSLQDDAKEILREIYAIVNEEAQWVSSDWVAFNRGRITGMCHRVGIGLDSDE